MSLTAMGIAAGSGLLSAGINAAFNDKPSIPNYSAERYAQYQQRRQDLEEGFQQQADELEATLAASGRSGSAGTSAREELYDSTNQSSVDFAAKEADAIARAENKEKKMEYGRDLTEYQNRAQAISDTISGAGQMYATQLMEDTSSPQEQQSGGNVFDLGGVSKRSTMDDMLAPMPESAGFAQA